MNDERLDSWKEIAGYLGRGVRTVARWEAREGLPVHRHVHARQATVYAYKRELDAWRLARGALFEKAKPWRERPRRRLMLAAALVLLALAAAWLLADRKLILIVPGQLADDEVRQRVAEGLERAKESGGPIVVTVQ